MKTKLIALLAVLLFSAGANAQNAPANEQPAKKILIAYFSWGGNTQHVAEHIAALTGGTLFRIEPEKPYPTEYTPCTEVAKAEKEADARPAIKKKVEDWEQYDTIFIGCPVWWWTAPMIINTFTEGYDFKGNTVIPYLRFDLSGRNLGADCRADTGCRTSERIRCSKQENERCRGMVERN